MSGRMTPQRILRLTMTATAIAVAGGCQPPPANKPPVKAEQAAEPRWRQIRTDEDSATYMTPAVQSVGAYKRFWLSELYAKPKVATIRGETGILARRDDLIEVDCAETRVRMLQTTFMDGKDWSATETPEKPEWFFVNPDVRNMVTVRHACAGEKLTGKGYASMKEARVAYHASLTAPKGAAKVTTKGPPTSHP
jgi:hypothetical protein